jgi:hypothetical protein
MSISRYLRGIEAPNQNIEDVSTDAGVALRESLNFEHANNAAMVDISCMCKVL